MKNYNNCCCLKKQFKSSIMRGTGEAYLLMKLHPEVDFSSEIKFAALRAHAYDPQSEGDRSAYLFQLISQSSQKEKIKDAILDKLAIEISDTWVLVQLFGLAALFAKNGDESAKKAIYKSLHKNRIPGSDWCGESAIIALDGFQGLRFIAESKGKLLQNNPDTSEDGSLVNFFQRIHPSFDVYGELKKAADSNSFIKTYVEAILVNGILTEERKMNKKSSQIAFDYNFISENIRMNRFSVPISRINEISQADIKKLADDFLIETDRLKQEKYLRIFAKVSFPYGYEYILNILKSKYSTKDRLIEFAVDALSLFTNYRIRDFALEQIAESKRPYIYTDLLIANFKNGDGKLLRRLLQDADNIELVHSLTLSYIKIFKINRDNDCVATLVDLYDKLNCADCRKDIIEIMIKYEVLPSKIFEEMQFDCNEEIQKLYLNQKGNKFNF